MLLAESDWGNIAAAVASITTFLALALKIWSDHVKAIRDEAKALVEKAEAKVEFEKTKAEALKLASEARTELKALADNVEVVRHQGNSAKEELVTEVRKASFMAGKEAGQQSVGEGKIAFPPSQEPELPSKG